MSASMPWKWTREQYYKLGALGFFAGHRVQLIRGQILEMGPVSWPHQLAKSLTAEALRRVFAEMGWVNEQGPLRVAESEPEPDVSVIAGQLEDYTERIPEGPQMTQTSTQIKSRSIQDRL